LMSERVLITGSEGFTGRYLRAELEAHGYQVVGLGAHGSSSEAYCQADLRNLASVKQAAASLQPDYVVHLAALAFVGHGNPNDFYDVNLVGTRNLLSALAECSKTPKCVLIASSANVYGNQQGGVLDEQAAPAPVNDYAVSKLAMEYMAKTWLTQLPITLVRPFNYTGLGQANHFLLPKIVSHFRKRAPVIELGNLDVWRDFSDVRAVVEAYRRLLECQPAGETFNVASGGVHSLREILTMCSDLTGHDMEVKVNPAFVRNNEVKTLCGSAQKLRECIGNWNTPALRETLQWMLVGKS